MMTSSCDDRPTLLFSALLLCKLLLVGMKGGRNISESWGFGGKSVDRAGDEGEEEEEGKMLVGF